MSYANIGDLVENLLFIGVGILVIFWYRKSEKRWIMWMGVGLVFFKSLQLILNFFVFKK